jgi:hypothetical protein
VARTFICHPGEASNASGRKDLPDSFASHFVILTTGALAMGGPDLGQLRVSEAGSGFLVRAIARAPFERHA